jgi:hypothetical protein
MKFFTVTTRRNGPVDLVPHWLDHYLRIGVDQFVLCVLREGMEPRLDEIRSMIAGLPVHVHLFSDWTDARQELVMRHALDEVGCRPRDWVVRCDVDELNEFPCPIDVLARAMDKADKAAVHGHFIDRVALEGKLAALAPTPSLARQYPIECRLTEKILGGFTQKIMLARHEVTMHPGHHEASAPSGNHEIGAWQDYRVHHFKWRDGIMERLDWTLANVAKRDSSWGIETQKFLDFVKPFGRIPVEDPRISAVEVGEERPRAFARTDCYSVLAGSSG